MKGGKNRQPLGYTIVEVMIVLAVSSLMFAIAANFINGKQARSSFTAGVNSLASRVQSTIEQVTDGSYSDIPLNCSVTGGGLSFTGGSTGKCMFLGKILHFDESNNQTAYEVFTIAGARFSASGAPVTTLSTAFPTAVIAPSDLTNQQAVPQSLSVKDISFTTPAGATVTSNYAANSNYALAFLQGLGSVDVNGVLQSGTQNISIYYVSIGAGDNEGAAAGHFTPVLSAASPPVAQSATLCVTDGTRYATVGIGLSNNSQLSVNVQVVPVC